MAGYQTEFVDRLGLRPLTLEGLRRYLDYNAETGLVHYKESTNDKRIGLVAGHVAKRDGYVSLKVGGKLYQGHRLAWFYVHGVWPKPLDHINRNTSDNRLSNLREASPSENMGNRSASQTKKLAVKGVYEERGRYRAFFKKDGRVVWSGVFESLEDAQEIYAIMHRKYFGEFSHSTSS